MIIVGIDPGTIVCGYGVILIDGSHFTALDFGCIRPPPKEKLSNRYLYLFNGVNEILEKHNPHALAVETQYVSQNVQSAIKLGMARGAVILASAIKGIPDFHYSPSEVKKAIGNGQADKKKVQRMVQLLLRLAQPPHPEDASDALALAICHALTCSIKQPEKNLLRN